MRRKAKSSIHTTTAPDLDLAALRVDLLRLTADLGMRRTGQHCETKDKFFLDSDYHVVQVQEGCGKAACTCPSCRAVYSYQRSRRAWDMFGRSGEPLLRQWVFTFPPETWLQVFRDLKRTRGYLIELLQDVAGATGGYIMFHPEGGRDLHRQDVATEERHLMAFPHFHALFVAPGRKGADWGMMKRAFFAMLQRRFNYRPGADFSKRMVNLEYDVKDLPETQRFAFRYTMRHFPLWTAKATRSVPFGNWGPRASEHLPELPPEEAPEIRIVVPLRFTAGQIEIPTVDVFGNLTAWIVPRDTLIPVTDYGDKCRIFTKFLLPRRKIPDDIPAAWEKIKEWAYDRLERVGPGLNDGEET